MPSKYGFLTKEELENLAESQKLRIQNLVELVNPVVMSIIADYLKASRGFSDDVLPVLLEEVKRIIVQDKRKYGPNHTYCFWRLNNFIRIELYEASYVPSPKYVYEYGFFVIEDHKIYNMQYPSIFNTHISDALFEVLAAHGFSKGRNVIVYNELQRCDMSSSISFSIRK